MIVPSDTYDIREIILEQAVFELNLEARDSEEVIRKIVPVILADTSHELIEHATYVMLAREQQRSTGYGDGFACPHAKVPASRIYAGWFVSKEGIEFQAVDGKPVHIVFGLLSPPEHTSKHIQMLGRVSRLLSHVEWPEALMRARTVQEMKALVADGLASPPWRPAVVE